MITQDFWRAVHGVANPMERIVPSSQGAVLAVITISSCHMWGVIGRSTAQQTRIEGRDQAPATE
jgi:hypothetical protein